MGAMTARLLFHSYTLATIQIHSPIEERETSWHVLKQRRLGDWDGPHDVALTNTEPGFTGAIREVSPRFARST